MEANNYDIQRSHGDGDDFITHGDVYRAAEDLVDIYQHMVADMVDNCKSVENPCSENEICVSELNNYRQSWKIF